MTITDEKASGPAEALPAQEFVIAEIPDAFSTVEWLGIVRLVFTDRRLLVIARGPGSHTRSPLALRRWRNSPTLIRQPQLETLPLTAEPDALVWAITNSAITHISVGRPSGFSARPDECRLNLRAQPSGVEQGANLWKGLLGAMLSATDTVAGMSPGLNRLPRGFEFVVRSSQSAVGAVLARTPISTVLT